VSSGVKPRRRGRTSLARRVQSVIERECLFPRGTRALVMVSGGQDSLALLHLLSTEAVGSKGPSALHALHVNHHLRGAESDDDEALVVRFCDQMGVELTVAHRPVDKAAGNVQEAARDARREAGLAVAAQQECARIAIGHTADDQVETMLYRLGRYGGLAALTGMLPADPPWVRPLLGCRREETAAYCRHLGLEFAEDRGNFYPGYARTAIRETVLPAWEAALPGAVDAACRAAEVAAEIQGVVDDVVVDAARRVGRGQDPTGRERAESEATWGVGRETSGPAALCAEELSVTGLLSLSPAVRRLLLHEWLEARARPSASRAAVLAAEALLGHGGSAERSVGGGWRVCKEYDRLFLHRGVRALPVIPEPVSLPLPGVVEWGGLAVRSEFVERYAAPDVAREAYLDAGGLSGPLVVRAPVPGDRFRPFGAPGERKLQDVLVDLKVPASARRRQPLVVSGGRIVWVCGWVMAEEGRITRKTTAIIRLSVSPGDDRDREAPVETGEWRT